MTNSPIKIHKKSKKDKKIRGVTCLSTMIIGLIISILLGGYMLTDSVMDIIYMTASNNEILFKIIIDIAIVILSIPITIIVLCVFLTIAISISGEL